MSSSRVQASLNDIHVAGVVWIASDIHLSDRTPATTRAFSAFLHDAATQSDALFLPGDIFEVWVGDDFALNAPPAWLRPILDALLHTSRQIRLFLGRGNRDFLMGPMLAQRIGAQLLDDQVRLQTDIGSVLLSHGDEYCTADAGYQRFRRLVRNPAIQRMFLKLSLRTRRGIADWARNRSRRTNQNKPMMIMDVSPAAIHDAFIQSGCDLIVHGHTHRPATHDVIVGKRHCQRIVLPDWDYDNTETPRGGWLSLDKNGPVLHQTAALALTQQQPYHDKQP